MPELTLLIHAIVMLICAVELRVSMGNRERMNRLMKDNWNRRQEGRDLIAEAKAIANGHNAKPVEGQSNGDFTEPS